MNLDYISAIGNLLQNYHSDLNYIYNFQLHKKGLLKSKDYIHKTPGSFKSFLNEYRVARNIEKKETEKLLELTDNWISTGAENRVDNFAEFLKDAGITHQKTMTSLASKILFLNNPWNILPMDNLVKKAVSLKGNRYDEYEVKFKDFKRTNAAEIQKYLDPVEHYLIAVETRFKNELNEITLIRENRFLDKILWTIGKH